MNEKDAGLLFPKKEMKEKNPEKTMVTVASKEVKNEKTNKTNDDDIC